MFKIQIKESNQVLDLCRYSNGYRGWGEYSSFENASNVKLITSEVILFETKEEAEEAIKNGKQMLRGAFVVEVLEPTEQEILDKVLLDSENDLTDYASFLFAQETTRKLKNASFYIRSAKVEESNSGLFEIFSNGFVLDLYKESSDVLILINHSDSFILKIKTKKDLKIIQNLISDRDSKNINKYVL